MQFYACVCMYIHNACAIQFYVRVCMPVTLCAMLAQQRGQNVPPGTITASDYCLPFPGRVTRIILGFNTACSKVIATV